MRILSHIRVYLPKHKHHIYDSTKEAHPSTTSSNSSSSGCTSIIFPDGVSAEEYGLHPITKLEDVDTLQRFEVIRYLNGYGIEYDSSIPEESLRKLLKDTIALDKQFSLKCI